MIILNVMQQREKIFEKVTIKLAFILKAIIIFFKYYVLLIANLERTINII